MPLTKLFYILKIKFKLNKTLLHCANYQCSLNWIIWIIQKLNNKGVLMPYKHFSNVQCCSMTQLNGILPIVDIDESHQNSSTHQWINSCLRLSFFCVRHHYPFPSIQGWSSLKNSKSKIPNANYMIVVNEQIILYWICLYHVVCIFFCFE